MSVEGVRQYLKSYGLDQSILEFERSSATVEQAAQAAGVAPGRIAKTLAFDVAGKPAVICVAGDCRIDNRKFRAALGTKARLLTPEQTFEETGHQVGGVCPFALPRGVQVYLDASLQRFETVFPACGSSNSAIEISPGKLKDICPGAIWIDVAKKAVPS